MRPTPKKLRFLLASGPTREPLDPVRYLSNYSTGTMGRLLAGAVRRRGHALTWVRCPEEAETAKALLARLRRELPKHDVLIMAAAVCDVRPAGVSPRKIKKGSLGSVRLVENPDVLRELSRHKKKIQTFVGFALESQNVRANAMDKLRRKRMDLILAQKVTALKVPFGGARIDAAAYGADGRTRAFPRAAKGPVAEYLIGRAIAVARQKLQKLRVAEKGRV